MAPNLAKTKRLNYSLPKNAISRDYRITRSKLPGGSHVSIPYDGRKARCIVCKKLFLTKDVLRHHYEQEHKVLPETQDTYFINRVLPPFTHPSCWPAPVRVSRRQNEDMAARRERLDNLDPPDPRYERASLVQSYNDQVRLADMGARNEEEYKEIKNVQEYRIWNWWVEQQEVDLEAFADEGTHFLATDNAGMIDRSLQLSANTYHETATLPAPSEHAQEVYDESQAKTDSISGSRRNAELWWAAERAAGAGGRLTTDCELATRGPLKSEAVLQSLADANMAFVDRNGETAESRHTMAIAAEKLLTALRAQPHLDQLQEYRNNFRNKDFRQQRNVSQMGARQIAIREKKEKIWYMSEFRKDRARMFDTIQGAVEAYFAPYPDMQIYRPGGIFNTIILAAYEYAERLGATEVMEMLNRYFSGHGERLVAYLNDRYGEAQR